MQHTLPVLTALLLDPLAALRAADAPKPAKQPIILISTTATVTLPDGTTQRVPSGSYHDADPHEMRNLIADPAHQDVVAQFQKRLRESRVGQSLNRK